MPNIEKRGNVTVIPKGEEFDVEWKLKFGFPEEDDTRYMSDDFSFEGEIWYLVIWPNGNKERDSFGYVDLLLFKRTSNGPPIHIKVSLALKIVSGQKDLERRCTEIFEGEFSRHYIHRLISKSNFEKRQSEFLSSGTLTVVCTLKRLNSTGSASNITTADCSYCEKTFGSQEISSHEKKCRVKCPECSDVMLLQNWEKHECQISRAEGIKSLSKDFMEMLLEGCYHDLILKIGEGEFRAHKDVLAARSRVFKSMFSHDMVEKNSGVIDVPDCDSQAMEQFLRYVYSGKVEYLDKSNMNGLYYIADKYEMKDLKEECSKFIKKSLSPTNFCDIIQLALKHSDSSLLDFATEYFVDNVLDILRTVEWQSFIKDNSIEANELLIKSHEKKK